MVMENSGHRHILKLAHKENQEISNALFVTP